VVLPGGVDLPFDGVVDGKDRLFGFHHDGNCAALDVVWDVDREGPLCPSYVFELIPPRDVR